MNVSRRVAVAASLGAMLSVQAGAAVAKHLFPLVGADGASLLRIGLGVAVFSSAIPFTLELVALKGLPEKTFSIILSLEPAIAALIGFVALQEVLRPVQLVAMACVIVASVGSTLSAKSPSP